MRQRSAEPIPKRDRPTEAPNSAGKKKKGRKRKRRRKREKEKEKTKREEEQEGRIGSHTLILAETLLRPGR